MKILLKYNFFFSRLQEQECYEKVLGMFFSLIVSINIMKL